MISKKIFGYLVTLMLIALFSPLFSFGQNIPSAGSLSIKLIPDRPEPLQSVNVSLESYSYDLNRTRIIWSVNNIEKRNEVGLKELTVQAGKSGQKTTVKATAITPDGNLEAEISFIPAVVDLIYEPASYVPPFYKGRASNPNQGTVLVSAIPELIRSSGEKVPLNSTLFAWKKNDKVEQSASGLGKNVLTFTGTVPIRDTLIEVTASSIEGDVSAYKRINIGNGFPKIIFYENNPVYGIMFNKAIKNNVNMLSDEFRVIAIPYFFGTNSATNANLDYTWSMNGREVGGQEPKNSFTTRVDNSGSGTADIGLKISNNVDIFQFIEDRYSINFSKK